LGGEISKFSQMSIGASVVMNLRDIKPDLCIIGANAIDLEEGFTDSDWDTVEVKKAMVNVSYSLAVLAITDKLNSIMKYKIADVDKINYFVTEASPDSEIFSDIKVRFPKIIVF
jgi:DeoR/GlpR family transcriptional regulator of sugar metabolism